MFRVLHPPPDTRSAVPKHTRGGRSCVSSRHRVVTFSRARGESRLGLQNRVLSPVGQRTASGEEVSTATLTELGFLPAGGHLQMTDILQKKENTIFLSEIFIEQDVYLLS